MVDWCKSSLYGEHPNQPELNTQVRGNIHLRCSPGQKKALLGWLTVTHPAKIMKFPDVCHYLDMHNQAQLPLHLHTLKFLGAALTNLPQANLLAQFQVIKEAFCEALSFTVTLAQVNGCDGGTPVCTGGHLWSLKNAEIVEKGFKHRSSPQERIVFKTPSAASDRAGRSQRHFDVQINNSFYVKCKGREDVPVLSGAELNPPGTYPATHMKDVTLVFLRAYFTGRENGHRNRFQGRNVAWGQHSTHGGISVCAEETTLRMGYDLGKKPIGSLGMQIIQRESQKPFPGLNSLQTPSNRAGGLHFEVPRGGGPSWLLRTSTQAASLDVPGTATINVPTPYTEQPACVPAPGTSELTTH
ncbi:hypothetical protein EK904_012813 [Melospiza melodia maxima]|nr:hypothetical protein EK904_012813 [Melospiza melodia maxima]